MSDHYNAISKVVAFIDEIDRLFRNIVPSASWLLSTEVHNKLLLHFSEVHAGEK